MTIQGNIEYCNSSNQSMSKEFPRPGSMIYDIMKGDKEKRSKTIGRFKFWNKYFVIPLYRANIMQLFFAGKIFILLKTVGRKSGKDRYSPLEYRVKDGDMYLFSSRGIYADWYRNMEKNPEKVMVKKNFTWFKPKLEFLESLEERREIMKWYAETYPTATQALFGWDKNNDSIENADLDPIAEYIRIIRIIQ